MLRGTLAAEEGPEIRRSIVLSLALATLTGCTFKSFYTPGVYEIAPDRIEPFEVKGSVAVVNVQARDDQGDYEFFRLQGAVWETDRRLVTQALADQLAREIAKLGGGSDTPPTRTLSIAVPAMSNSEATWTWTVYLTVDVAMGDRPARRFEIKNTSPGNVQRVVNGGIAIAVIEILSDRGVRDFLRGNSPQ